MPFLTHLSQSGSRMVAVGTLVTWHPLHRSPIRRLVIVFENRLLASAEKLIVPREGL